MPRIAKPVAYFAELLRTPDKLSKNLRLRARRIVAGLCLRCGKGVAPEGRRSCLACQPPKLTPPPATPDLKGLAEAAYQRWLVAQAQRLGADGWMDCTEAQILKWAETNKAEWLKGWIEVYLCEQGERPIELPPVTGWEGWQPANCWHAAGGGSD